MRGRAVHVLVEVEKGKFAGDVFGAEEHRFVRELVLGVLRRRLTLDAVHAAFGRRALDDLDPPVRAAVRAGLYQMLFMDGVPDHAAIAETVGAAPERGRGYVNAVLRSVQRESNTVDEGRDRGGASPTKRLARPGRTVTFFSRAVFPDPEESRPAWLSVVYSHPLWLVERWLARDDEAVVIARMEADNAPASTTLRPRAGRVDAAGLLKRLRHEDLPAARIEREGADAVAVAPGTRKLLTSRAFKRGLFSVQALEQMDAVEVLDAQPGETVWDACAAPGGKTTQLAERLEGHGRVVATDASAGRLERVHENLQRLGLTNVDVEVFDILGDTAPPGVPEGGFDAILLDAPCSNTAVLGRRPEARWRLDTDAVTNLAERQRRLIDAVRQHLAPGGRLIYSTCSLEPEENEGHGLEPTRSPFVWIGKRS